VGIKDLLDKDLLDKDLLDKDLLDKDLLDKDLLDKVLNTGPTAYYPSAALLLVPDTGQTL